MPNIVDGYTVSACLTTPEIKDGKVRLISAPGQDHFNIPELHVAASLPRLTWTIAGDFTMQVDCRLEGCCKFDAAGICVVNGVSLFKFGVENYGKENGCRLVTVVTELFSDEAVGDLLIGYKATLAVSRNGSCLTSYAMLSGEWCFQRAFCLPKATRSVDIGLFTQAPFNGAPVSGYFDNIEFGSSGLPHTRK